MTDPLSVTASLIAVLQLSAVVVTYLKDVKDAGSDRAKLLVEISSTKGVLETLDCVAKEDDNPDRLSVLKDPLASYDSLLKRLEKALAPSHGVRKLGKALKWPFDKPEVRQLLLELERCKSLFSLALHTDQHKLTQGIGQALAEWKEHLKDEEFYEVAKWLSALDFDPQQDAHFAHYQEGTATWLLEDERFHKWKAGHCGLLWCTGKPGVGKTVLASLAFHHLTETAVQKDCVVLGLYCEYRDAKQQSISKYLASLLQQLILQRGSLPESLKRIHRENKIKQSPIKAKDSLNLLQEQLQDLERSYIIIDALDECTEENGVREELLDAVLHLPESTSVMITSRDIHGLSERFTDATKMKVSANDADIHLLVSNRLSKEKTWARRIGLDQAMKTTLTTRISGKARGMFLLAQLHLDAIVRKHTRKDVEKALEQLPTKLSEAYEDMLRRIDDQCEEDASLARRVLAWLTFAHGPLKSVELQQLLAVEDGYHPLDEEGLRAFDLVHDVCVGLVDIDKGQGVIRFVHYSTKEHFFNIGAKEFEGSHLSMAMTCLNFLYLNTERNERLEDLYVVENWHRYIRESPEPSQLVDRVVAFLQDKDRLRALLHSTPDFMLDLCVLDDQYWNASPIHPLHLAANLDLVEVTKRLLEIDASSINVEANQGETPLYHAIGADDGLVADLLLKRPDVDVNISTWDSRAPSLLHRALKEKRQDIAKRLLQKGADPEVENERGLRPLHFAIKYELLDVLQDLIERKVDLAASMCDGHRLIEVILSKDRSRRWLERWPDVAIPGDNSGFSLWDELRREGEEAEWIDRQHRPRRNREISEDPADNLPALELVLKALTAADIDRGQMIMDAVMDGRHDLVQNMLKKGAKAHFHSSVFGQKTPLCWAAGQGFLKCVEVLIENGGDVDAPDAFGSTPLHCATNAGHEDVVLVLVSKVDNINVRGGNRLTPLECARRQNHGRIQEILLAAGAMNFGLLSDEPDPCPPCTGQRSRCSPQSSSSADSVPSQTSADEEEFLDAAALGNIDLVRSHAIPYFDLGKCKYFWGVNLDVRDMLHGKTALHWAAEAGHSNIIDLLTSKRVCDTYIQDLYGKTPLHYAAENGHGSCITALVNVKTVADPELVQKAVIALLPKGETPILDSKGSVTWDKQKRTSNHSAKLVAQEMMVRTIMGDRVRNRHASAMSVPDHDGLTPLWYARRRGEENIVRLLKDMKCVHRSEQEVMEQERYEEDRERREKNRERDRERIEMDKQRRNEEKRRKKVESDEDKAAEEVEKEEEEEDDEWEEEKETPQATAAIEVVMSRDKKRKED